MNSAPNPVPTIGRQVNYCVPPADPTPMPPISGSFPTADQGGVPKETIDTGEGVVTQPAPVPVDARSGAPLQNQGEVIPAPGTPQAPDWETLPPGMQVAGRTQDAWVVWTATISAVAPDVATSGLVTLSVFTNDPECPVQVVEDAPFGGGQFIPGCWNWPTIG